MKNWMSRYSFNYPRFLVYMLQASEYNIRDYLKWHREIRDFTLIEKRKKLEKTLKGKLLLIVSWTIVFLIIGLAFYVFWSVDGLIRYFLFFLIACLLPYVLAYGIIVPLILINFTIQRPIEFLIINKAKKKLKNHSAFKIGVAGSFGKTTMREIIKTILSENKKVAASPGNYNTLLGTSEFIKRLKGDEEVLIFELGEYYPGDIRKLCDLINPDMGVITGINEAHLKKFKSMERTIKTINELVDCLGSKPIYVNGENEIARKNSRPNDILYSREGTQNLKIENADTGLSGTSFVLMKEKEKIKMESSLLGLHQIGPLVTAIDISLKLGLSLSEIKEGIKKTEPFNHRLEIKDDESGVVILDDSYNGNPDGVKAAIEFLSSLGNHRKFYVTPGLVEMGSREKEVHNEIGRNLAKANIEKIILIKNSVTPYIEEGLKEKGHKGEVLWFDDALTAFNSLPQLTVEGDIVLLQNDWSDQYQ